MRGECVPRRDFAFWAGVDIIAVYEYFLLNYIRRADGGFGAGAVRGVVFNAAEAKN